MPGKGHLTGFGLDIGAFALRWFQDYYGIPYPSDKVDLLALPDFAAGAMENLGCITFRESLLLVDPATSTQAEQQLVADVVAHELAHMWFGDLVTMRWWNGIWLNEAFATFMELAACDAFRPDWERWTLFGLERSAAFETDSLASTRPVEYEVRSPQDCEGMFDVLTYQKGGALLRMLEQYLGDERFRQGVSHYLRAARLREHRDQRPVGRHRGDQRRAGAPDDGLVDLAARLPARDGRRSTATSSCCASSASPSTPARWTPTPAPTTWLVPVHVRAGGAEHDGPARRATRPASPLADPAAPVVVNAGGHGFFRVAYGDELRGRLAGDVLAVARHARALQPRRRRVERGRRRPPRRPPTSSTFVEGFGAERELAVWQAIVLGLRGLGRLLDDDAYPAFQARVRALARARSSPTSASPAEGEDDLRGQAARPARRGTLAVQGDDAATQARAAELFDRSEAAPGTVDPELVAAATSIVAAERRRRRLRADARRLPHGGHAAGPAAPPLRARRVRRRGADPAHVRAGDERRGEDPERAVPAAHRASPTAATARRRGRSCASTGTRPTPRSRATRSCAWSTPCSCSPTRPVVADVQAFFAEHPIAQAAKTLDQVLERQRVNTALRAREQRALRRRPLTPAERVGVLHGAGSARVECRRLQCAESRGAWS